MIFKCCECIITSINWQPTAIQKLGGGGSTKPEVSLMSSKGPGPKSQPEVKILTSFCITFEFDENQQPQRQGKLMCLFSYVYKHYIGWTVITLALCDLERRNSPLWLIDLCPRMIAMTLTSKCKHASST